MKYTDVDLLSVPGFKNRLHASHLRIGNYRLRTFRLECATNIVDYTGTVPY